ncbi:MAG: threonine ammonia-lyase [Tissierella sp.]|uniref:threonine ammonia-lyase n=1 Tax=Tissierella sp. TaxID=41274 RepID=UPI003F9C0632
MLKLEDFNEARKKLEGVITRRGLIHSEVLSEESGNDIYLKPENLQKTRSFKVRGSYNKISKLNEEEKTKGVIASSAGNHAQGVALAATQLGIKSTIVMPRLTPFIKVEATKGYGAEVVLHGEVYDDAYKKAVELQKEHGYTFIHPFNDEDVIAGQGTIALEVLEELPDADIILVPIGGGGLISGIATAAKLINPNIKVIGVEPKGAASATAAMEAGKVVEIAESNTIADGTAVKTIGDINYEYIKKYVDEIIKVSDYELMETFLLMVEKHKLVAENSGLLSVAAAKKIKEKGKKIVSVISGGNIDVLAISSMLNKGLTQRGRIFSFALNLPDKPGQIETIAGILANANANIKKIDHNQFVNLDKFNDLELRVTVETNGEDHINKITEALAESGYKVRRLYNTH